MALLLPDRSWPGTSAGACGWSTPASTTAGRAEAGHRALEAGYGVVCVVALWLIDLAVVALSLFLRRPHHGPAQRRRGRRRPGGLAVAVALLPVAAYPITAWAGARSALARAILAPGSWSWTSGWSRSPGRGRAWSTPSSWTGGGSSATCTTAPAAGRAHRGPRPGQARPGAGLGRRGKVDTAHEQARQALAELRELIRGVHPQVLTDRGLPAAVADAAGRSPVKVDTDVVLPRRLPAGIEVAAYFAVCEALANVAKHSRASRASVRAGWWTTCWSSEVPTTASAAPTRRPGPGSPGWPTGSRWWTAACCCPARPVGRPWYAWRSVRADGPLRIVLAEDAVLLREGMSELLRRFGHDVVPPSATRRPWPPPSRRTSRTWS